MANAPGWSPVQGRCVISYMAVVFHASIFFFFVCFGRRYVGLSPSFVTNNGMTMGNDVSVMRLIVFICNEKDNNNNNNS